MSGKLINNPLVMVQSTSSASKMPSKGPSKPTEANTEVYFWYLDNNIAANETSIPLYTQDMPSVHDSGSKRVESVVNSVDGRTKVDREDYEESSGRFRGRSTPPTPLRPRRIEAWANRVSRHCQTISPL